LLAGVGFAVPECLHDRTVVAGFGPVLICLVASIPDPGVKTLLKFPVELYQFKGFVLNRDQAGNRLEQLPVLPALFMEHLLFNLDLLGEPAQLPVGSA
jgi:hypothetical protein